MKIANDLVIYEVVIKQNLRAFLDISENEKREISSPLLGLVIDCLLLNTAISFFFFLLLLLFFFSWMVNPREGKTRKMLEDHQSADTRNIPDPCSLLHSELR